MLRSESENQALCKKYPWLKVRNYYGVDSSRGYECSMLDGLPDGWDTAFGEQMCKEIQDAIDAEVIKDFAVLDIKEKFGGMRFYYSPVPKDSKIHYIVDKYEEMSRRICVQCGKKATRITLGWIIPLCDKCATRLGELANSVDIDSVIEEPEEDNSHD